MIARDYLIQIKKLDRQIQNKIYEYVQIKEMSVSITVSTEGERVQSSGCKDKIGDLVVKMIAIQEDINKLIDKRADIIKVIEQVSDADNYDILHKRYVQCMTWEAIATSIIKKNGEQMSYQWVTELHKRALKDIQDILDN